MVLVLSIKWMHSSSFNRKRSKCSKHTHCCPHKPLPELDSVDGETRFILFFPRRASKMALIFCTICWWKENSHGACFIRHSPSKSFAKEFWRKWLFPPFFRCLIFLSHFSCIFISSGSMPTGQCLSQSHKSLMSQGLHWLGPLFDSTFGIFLRRRLYGSPDRHGVSSGLLGVDGGLTRDGDAMPPSLPVLRSSSSLKLRRSEFCLKKPGLEESCHRQSVIQSQSIIWFIRLP